MWAVQPWHQPSMNLVSDSWAWAQLPGRVGPEVQKPCSSIKTQPRQAETDEGE